MTREEIVALFARRQLAVDRRDADALAALHAEDSVVESLMAGTVTGRAAIADVYQAWFTAFPDVVMTIGDLVIDGDRVVLLNNVVGTDIGGFMGLPPTGRAFRVSIVHIYTLSGSEIQHERRIYDFTGLLMQIGVLKARPA
jgi:steroid delta-isomerase-like uncharacterized protein